MGIIIEVSKQKLLIISARLQGCVFSLCPTIPCKKVRTHLKARSREASKDSFFHPKEICPKTSHTTDKKSKIIQNLTCTKISEYL